MSVIISNNKSRPERIIYVANVQTLQKKNKKIRQQNRANTKSRKEHNRSNKAILTKHVTYKDLPINKSYSMVISKKTSKNVTKNKQPPNYNSTTRKIETFLHQYISPERLIYKTLWFGNKQLGSWPLCTHKLSKYDKMINKIRYAYKNNKTYSISHLNLLPILILDFDDTIMPTTIMNWFAKSFKLTFNELMIEVEINHKKNDNDKTKSPILNDLDFLLYGISMIVEKLLLKFSKYKICIISNGQNSWIENVLSSIPHCSGGNTYKKLLKYDIISSRDLWENRNKKVLTAGKACIDAKIYAMKEYFTEINDAYPMHIPYIWSIGDGDSEFIAVKSSLLKTVRNNFICNRVWLKNNHYSFDVKDFIYPAEFLNNSRNMLLIYNIIDNRSKHKIIKDLLNEDFFGRLIKDFIFERVTK